MEAQKIKIVKIIERAGSTVEALIEFPGFVGRFRIAFADKTRKNGNLNLEAYSVYYSPVLPEDGHYSHSWEVKNITDSMLFVERHLQWILEQMTREFELYFRIAEFGRRQS